MSSKNTIILTNDYDEHWFEDCNERLDDTNDAITLEFSKENIRIEANDEDCLILTITNANSELYNFIKQYKKQ